LSFGFIPTDNWLRTTDQNQKPPSFEPWRLETFRGVLNFQVFARLPAQMTESIGLSV
jgi:hypothetical protein